MGERRLKHGVRLRVRYDGTELHGWQHQPGYRTAQGALVRALDKMIGESTHSDVRGASRTDAGVHAEGQVAAFDVDREIPPRGWVLGLNGLLPKDVAVASAEPIAPGYQPRFDARRKTYRYAVYTGTARDPLLRRRAWYIGPGLARKDHRVRHEGAWSFLDVDAMREAARILEGTHDFKAFRAVGDERKTTTRTMQAVRILEDPLRRNVLVFEVTGTAFMKNMVRIIAGTLVEVGRRRFTMDQVRAMVGPDANRRMTGPTAPPEGLTLISIVLGRMDEER